ncbi:hypothetical protein BCV69DRAFT_282460 [Microstroma glucosiphilum]|uniref:Uncharacterized protein n=1 Tax=Pseudomicrostroma glucosiphilum TaxID=1684307 RepID=A0A316U915_9BASI|nr:hypothetical protein BCV69DRAFT_282460 [Pseudomicrostroma glucosiphilum]PWN20951.1 hypothetical protein BCV69DRAFT_282460 [Pseudomicrostroma glucosiphilum]
MAAIACPGLSLASKQVPRHAAACQAARRAPRPLRIRRLHTFPTAGLPTHALTSSTLRISWDQSARVPALPRDLQQSSSYSATTSIEKRPSRSPWTDEPIQQHLEQLRERIKRGSTGLGISGSRSPLESFEAAFPYATQRQSIQEWLTACGFTVEDLLSLCSVFQLSSWSDCRTLLQDRGISGEWPRAFLLHALDQITSLTEVAQGLHQVDAQLHTMDARSIVTSLSSLLEAMCLRTSAVHLFAKFTDLLERGADVLFRPCESQAEGASASPWRTEFMELVEDYLLNLTKWADPRTRHAALRIVALSDRLRQDKLIAEDTTTHLRHILCGITEQESTDTPVVSRTSYLTRKRPDTKLYDWLFLEEKMWGALAQGMDTESEGEQLLFAAFFANHAAQTGQRHLFEHLSAFVTGLQTQLSPTSRIWQAAMVQYIRAIMNFRGHSTGRAIALSQEVLQQALPHAFGRFEMRLWRAFFRCGIERSDIDPNFFLDLLSPDKQGRRVHSSRLTPSASCLKDANLYDCLLSGLSRKREHSKQDLETGHLIWHHMHNRGIAPSSRSAINMARLSILGGYWSDALDMLSYLALDSAAKEAVSALQGELEVVGLPIHSFTSDRTALPLPSGSRITVRKASDNTFASRTILSSVLRARQPLACFPVWRNVTAILGSPFDAFSLAGLLQAALHLSNLTSSNKYEAHVSVEWAGATPIVRAKNVFRRTLLSQHPELALENSALVAMRTGQDWITRSEMQLQRWEAWVHNALAVFRRKSRHLKVIKKSNKPYRHEKGQLALNHIVFDARHFELFLIVCLHIRHLSGGGAAGDTESNWQQILQVLSWMRYLDIEPTTDSLCYVSQVIWESLPPAASGAMWQTEEKPMGPLQDWCEEWIRPEVMPTMKQVQLRNYTQFKTLRSSSWEMHGMEREDGEDEDDVD